MIGHPFSGGCTLIAAGVHQNAPIAPRRIRMDLTLWRNELPPRRPQAPGARTSSAHPGALRRLRGARVPYKPCSHGCRVSRKPLVQFLQFPGPRPHLSLLLYSPFERHGRERSGGCEGVGERCERSRTVGPRPHAGYDRRKPWGPVTTRLGLRSVRGGPPVDVALRPSGPSILFTSSPAALPATPAKEGRFQARARWCIPPIGLPPCGHRR